MSEHNLPAVIGDFEWRPKAGLAPEERWRAWGKSFNYVYSAGLRATITAGRVLIEAKAEIPHGEWEEWLRIYTPVSPRTASRLMKVAGDPNILRELANRPHAADLPNDYTTLAEICGLEPERFDALIEAGTIHAEMKRGDVRKALVAGRHDPPPALPELPPQKWRAILADPPWPFETYGGGNDRAAENHYPTMTLNDIEFLPVMNLAADDALLFLWVTSDRIKDAPRVMVQWGFELVSTAFIWVKDRPGKGYWTRKGSELCLLGKRGNPKRLSASVNEVIEAPRGAHSEKPDEVYDRIHELAPGPYIELFARRPRAGWDAWGNDPALRGDGDG